MKKVFLGLSLLISLFFLASCNDTKVEYDEDIEKNVITRLTAEQTITIPTSINDKEITGVASDFIKEADKDIVETIIVPDEIVYLAPGVFSNFNNLKKVVFGKGITKIPERCFEYSMQLEEVEFQGEVTEFEYKAFSCSHIKKLEIPDTVIKIGDYALELCDFKTLVIPDSVLSIGTGILGGCLYLEDLTLPYVGKNAADSDRSLAWMLNSTVYPNSGESLKKLTISNKCQSIPKFAFKNCNIEELYLGKGITVIPQACFQKCKSLKMVSMQSVTSIGSHAFDRCESLKTISFSSCLKEIRMNAFSLSGLSGSITIPASVERIGENAFSGTSITHLYFENENGWRKPTGIYTTVGDGSYSAAVDVSNPTAISSVLINKGYEIKRFDNFVN